MMSEKRDKFAFFVKVMSHGLTQPAFFDESKRFSPAPPKHHNMNSVFIREAIKNKRKMQHDQQISQIG